MYISDETKLKLLTEDPEFEFMGSEADFEQNVIDNIDQICAALELPQPIEIFRQKITYIDNFKIKPDILIRHEDETRTIIEVKKANQKHPAAAPVNQMNGIGQLLLYGNVFETKTGAKARLALIDTKIFYRTYCAFLGNRLPIALMELQKDRLFVPYNGWRYAYE